MKDLKILSKRKLLDGFVDVDALTIQQRQLNGSFSPELLRYVINRPDAVCAVVENTDRGTVAFVRQIRVAIKPGDDAWFVELAAGLVDPGESLETAMAREIREELGYVVDKLHLLHKTYPSPGLSSERVFIYHAQVTDLDKRYPGGGNAEEHEDIEVLEIPIAQLPQLLGSDRLVDSKTLTGLYAFLFRCSRDQVAAG